MTENKDVGSLWVTVRVVFSFQGSDPDFQLETSAFPKNFRILEEINYRKGDGSKQNRQYSVGGRGLRKKISVHKFISWIDLLCQVIQCFQKANYLTDATNRLWGNSYIYTPWAVVTTKIHKATEHSRHLRLPKVLWILTDNTDRSHCTYSQFGEGTTAPHHPPPRPSQLPHVTGDRNVLLWGLVATLIKGFLHSGYMKVIDTTREKKKSLGEKKGGGGTGWGAGTVKA